MKRLDKIIPHFSFEGEYVGAEVCTDAILTIHFSWIIYLR